MVSHLCHPIANHGRRNQEPEPSDPAWYVELLILAHFSAPLEFVSAPQLFSLSNPTVFMAGAARVLGIIIAQSVIQSGAHVVSLEILDRPVEPKWSETLAFAKKRGVTIKYGRLDVTDDAQVAEAFSSAFQEARTDYPVRGLVHCASIQLLKEALEVSAAEFQRYLLSDAASFMTGADMGVEGGHTAH